MGSKVSENKNEIRPKIANYIKMHPGTSFKTIKTIFDLSDGTLRYHLRYLEKKGKIKSGDNKRIYYPIGHVGESSLNKTQQRLINTIKRHPGITQKELSAKTKMNRLTIRNNINLLVEREMLSIIKIGKEIHHFYITPQELEKKKVLRLIAKFLLGKIDEETYWDLRLELAG
ncbi:MAG: winged helix-turn-helix transcriptional regulator [Candidatus Heimdallarchaeota archaeon]|jgi:predicted transcriptional regulator|nr:MAG: winged helix-turn-helix transcriptional regulator [Candidatus Heimdallarchaeota archaeon]